MSPGVVDVADIIEFGLDGAPVAAAVSRELPRERFIHAAIYEARPDVKAVLHASPEDILPFGITQTPLRPVIASVGDMGLSACRSGTSPSKFGDATDLAGLRRWSRAAILRAASGTNRVVLLRGEGFVVTGRTLNDVVRLSAYIPRNGRAIMAATPLGRIESASRPERWRRGLRSTRSRTPCGAAGNTGRGRPAAANCWRISRIGRRPGQERV